MKKDLVKDSTEFVEIVFVKNFDAAQNLLKYSTKFKVRPKFPNSRAFVSNNSHILRLLLINSRRGEDSVESSTMFKMPERFAFECAIRVHYSNAREKRDGKHTCCNYNLQAYKVCLMLWLNN